MSDAAGRLKCHEQLNAISSKKRAWNETEFLDIDRRPLTIKSTSTETHSTSHTLIPICLLARSQLPLAALDPCQRQARFFTAHIRALGYCHEHEEKADVLVAEDQNNRRLYAIERVQNRCYTLCRLAASISEDDVLRCAKASHTTHLPQRKRLAINVTHDGATWWHKLIAPTSETYVKSADVKLEEDAPNVRQPALDQEVLEGDAVRTVIAEGLRPLTVDKEPEASSIPADWLQDLAQQYLETLYLSRTPLSYFVKGPLARTRTAYTNDHSPDLGAETLIGFLRASILSSAVTDKKYHSVIPDMIIEWQKAELNSVKISSHRAPRKWKPKRDKSGLFVTENKHVEQWWQNSTDGSAVSDQDDLKRRLQALRTRETFLQIILILEVLALEESAKVEPSDTGQAPPVVNSNTKPKISENVEHEKAVRKKKDVDLDALLESLTERLCIWLALDSASPAKNSLPGEGNDAEQSNDELKGFCLEVIVPFYLSRIPKHAGKVSKKFGGPSRPAPKRLPSGNLFSKPGEPAVRQNREKTSRRPLSRVSSDVLNKSKTIPSLHRSATDTQFEIEVKRERSGSVSLLDSVPMVKKHSQANGLVRKRPSLLERVSQNVREVDLTALSRANEAKIRKKAEVDEKLRDAIETMKKPNRTLAVEEIAKSADESFAKAIARGRTTTRPQPNRQQSQASLTVEATPNVRRSTGGYPLPVVPASTIRPRPMMRHANSDTPVFVPQTGHRRRTSDMNDTAQETPSRGFARFMPVGLSRPPGNLHESPIATRKSLVAQTPSRSSGRTHLVDESPIRTLMLSATPVQRKASYHDTIETPHLTRTNIAQLNQEAPLKGSSIYDMMGWNDEYEDLA